MAPQDWRKPDIVGFHGQTVLHRPQTAVAVQLGDGARLAQATGFAVVYDMRANDMRAGGQGDRWYPPIMRRSRIPCRATMPAPCRRYS